MIAHDRWSAAFARVVLDLFGRRRVIGHLLAAKDAKGRLQRFSEPFVLIVADDQHDIRFGRGDDLAQRIELLLATIIMRLACIYGVPRSEILGPAQRVELVEVE